MSDVAPLSLLSAIVVLDTSLEGWSLLEPTEDFARVFRHRVAFSHTFKGVPIVQVGIVGLDSSKDDNLRIRIRPVDITSFGFTIEAETWFNTRLWSVEVSWLAIGT